MTFESVLGNGAFLHTILPLEPMTQKITHQIYFHWAVPTIIAKFYMLSEALQVRTAHARDTAGTHCACA